MVFSGPTNIRGESLSTIIDGVSWEEAELNANKLGGNLVTINDEDENKWLVDTYSNYFENDQNINRPWIGLCQNQLNTYQDFYDNKSNSWDNTVFKEQNAFEAYEGFVESLESPTSSVIGADGDTDADDDDMLGTNFQEII